MEPTYSTQAAGGWVWVLDPQGRRVERYRALAAAQRASLRLNGVCLHCGRPLAACKVDNPRDPEFGAAYDDGE